MSDETKRPLPLDDVIMSEEDCAAMIGVQPETLKRMRRAGQAPPAFEVNKYRFTYSRTLVLAWLQSRMVEGAALKKVEESES